MPQSKETEEKKKDQCRALKKTLNISGFPDREEEVAQDIQFAVQPSGFGACVCSELFEVAAPLGLTPHLLG